MSGKKRAADSPAAKDESIKDSSPKGTVEPMPDHVPGMSGDGDWDDLMTMEMIDSGSSVTETMPPENEEEAERRRLMDEVELKDEDDNEEDGEGSTAEAEEPEDEDVDDTDVADTTEADESDEENDDDSDDESDEPLIPKHRFDEVNAKRKAAEAELQRLRTESEADDVPVAPEPPQRPQDPYDYDAAEDLYQDAVLEGRKDEAKAIRREMRTAELEYAQAMARFEAEAVTTDNNINSSMYTTASNIEAMHPEFDAKSDNYDAELTKEALDLSAAYLNMPKYANRPNKALLDAAEQMLKVYGYLDRNGGRTDASALAKPAGNKKDVAKKIKVANSQPSKIKRQNTPKDEPMVDVSNISESEWEALPESTKARLRGDFV